MFGRLPHCDDLFLKFFDPWCSEADRRRRGFPATRPDMMQNESLVGFTEAQASPLPAGEQNQVRQQLDAILSAARRRWPDYLNVSSEVMLPWVDAFDRYWDRKRIQGMLRNSDPKDFSNDYVVTVCEFGSVLGHVMRGLQPRLVWYLERPSCRDF